MPAAGLAAKCRLAWDVLRHMGPRWVLFRLRYAWRLRSQALAKRLPLGQWTDMPSAGCHPLWPAMPQWPAEGAQWGNACVSDAQALAAGEWVLFFHHRLRLGSPPDWHRNTFSDNKAPRDVHWSTLDDFDFGDIKAIWEISRFSWAYTLARAYARTGDNAHAELFWRLFEDWRQQNPPNAGVNWKCGQESTFRLLATTFAVAQIQNAPATTPERRTAWSQFVIGSGHRIAKNIDFAISQFNNHGVSECVGLIAVGLLTETDEAKRWLATGLERLEPQLAELVYADGGFSQHSLGYHRVMMQDLLWAVVLLRAGRREVPDWLTSALRRALGFLAVLVDPQTGAAPFFGPNDGSKILPLDESPYEDFRETIQAGYALLDGVRVLPPGPWDEAVFWLTGALPSQLPLRPLETPQRWHAADSGMFQWKSGDARLFLMCPTYFRHRVAHADMLHVDVWWRGRPVTLDAGSYSYNAVGPLRGALGKAAAHNVLTLAGIEPLRKAGNHLHVPWPRGEAGWTANDQQFRATHDAYGKRARIERTIASPATGEFLVADKLSLATPGKVRLHWLLADLDWRLNEAQSSVTATIAGERFTISWRGSQAPCSVSLVRAEEGTARGWSSLHYLAIDPAVSLELLFDVTGQLEVSTRFGTAP